MRFHCLFEQSGTFRDVFRSYGHESWDYDIQDEYGKTDFQIDLFNEIEGAFQKLTCQDKTKCGIDCYCRKTIFDDMNPETDFIMAFFPCTSFTDINEINFTLQHSHKAKLKRENGGKQPLKNIEWLFMQIETREYMFKLWVKFCYICEQLGIPTIIENPAGGIGGQKEGRNYLKLYSPYRPSFFDMDRSKFGDVYKKPTMFFAINFEMKEKFDGMYYDNEFFTKVIQTRLKTKEAHIVNSKERSEITPRYANNFYKRFIENAIQKE